MMKRTSRIVLGLNSGTSCDGVDAAICEIRGRDTAMRVRLIGHVAADYPRELKQRLLAVMAPAETTTQEICRLHMAVGEAFAQAALRALRELGLRRVDLVGSHGQTICHLPPGNAETSKRPAKQPAGKLHVEIGNVKKSKRQNAKTNAGARIPSRNHFSAPVRRPLGGNPFALSAAGECGTLQIGDAAIISAALGAPVVSNFRQADMAVGGQGAPLVPWTDFVLFGHARRGRVIQNIGGIANLTWLPAGGDADDVIAFDCGPGNMIIDELVRGFSGARQAYDRGGRMAARGEVLPKVLAAMLGHPYLERLPPKSCGREEFGAAYTASMLKRFRAESARPEDWIATATRFTAECIARAYASLAAPINGVGAEAADDAGSSLKMGGMGNRRVGLSARSNRVPMGRLIANESRSVARASAGRSLESAIMPARSSNETTAAARARKRLLAHGTREHAIYAAGTERDMTCIDEVILCGGGAMNATLVRAIGEAAKQVGIAGDLQLTSMDDFGITTQAKECVSFAMLAAACVDRVPANLPRVTGASRRVVLGQLCDLSN